jgi:YD repeat-containing protein
MFSRYAAALLLLAQSPGAIQYIYDDLNRLVGVVDQQGHAATYSYDATGNLLKIDRFTIGQTPPRITAIVPAQAEAGRDVAVTITGQDLLAVRRLTIDNPGIHTRFLGTAPEAVSAVLAIAPTAPLGPATVTVTTAFGVATTTFTVVPPAPVLTRLDPSQGALGAAITLEGDGFLSAAGPTTVTFAALDGERVAAPLSSPATTSRLGVAVPARAVSGNVIVAVGGRPSNGLPFIRLVPAVASVSPADGASAVPVTSPVTVTFAHPIDLASVTSATFTIAAAGSSIPALLYATPTSASLYPSTRLAYGAEHAVAVSTGVTAPDGVPGVAFTGRFATETAPATDIRFDGIVATAAKGLPADPALPSANATQTITIHGANLASGVAIETSRLAAGIRQATPAPLALTGISADGSSAVATLGTQSGTGLTRLRKAGIPSVEAQPLQIVPTLGGVSVSGGGRLGPGKTVFLNGNGLTADLRVRFPVAGGGTVDQSIVAGSIDTFNVSAQVVVPPGLGSGPVVVITPGGTSNALVIPGLTRLENPDGTLAQAATGTPATVGEASTNGDQDIVVRGSGLAAGMALEIPTARNGAFFVNTLLGLTSFSADGVTARVRVPKFFSSAGIISGTGRVVQAAAALESPQSVRLQVVPTLTMAALPPGAAFGSGVTLTVSGSGFTADMIVRFPRDLAGTVDQPIVSGSVTQVGSQAQVVIPMGASRGALVVVTSGGQSNAVTP